MHRRCCGAHYTASNALLQVALFVCFVRPCISHAGHSQQLKFTSFQSGRPKFDKRAFVEEALAKKGIWRSTDVVGNSALSRGVFDVKASPSEVWNQLLDFASYPKKVPWVVACKVHHTEVGGVVKSAKNYTKRTLTKPEPRASWLPDFELPEFSIPSPPVLFKKRNHGVIERSSVEVVFSVLPGLPKLRSHVEFTFEPLKSSLTWTLDSEKASDFPAFVGHWHVAPHPVDSSKTRVFYETGLMAPNRFPPKIFKRVARPVIKDVTSWVKVQSERAMGRAEIIERRILVL